MFDFTFENISLPPGILPPAARFIFNELYPNFEKIPSFMRPEDQELKMIISSIDPDSYTKYDHGVIKFAIKNKLIPEISPLSIELADISAQCNMIGFENYISYSIANIIEKSQYDINC